MSVAIQWHPPGTRAAARGRLALLLAAPHLTPIVIQVVMTIAVFWQDLFGGLAYAGSDTVSYYYPLTSWYANELRTGHFPLWIPHMFGGYPVFADGEVGMAYPLHLLAYSLFPPDLVFAWLRPIHFLVAAISTYALARLLGTGALGATISGLTLAFGSFFVGHIDHDNIVRGAAWTPLVLVLFELAYRQATPRRALYLLGAGVVLGVPMLGVHVQPVLLSLLLYQAYVLVAPLHTPSLGH
ncbi:MAG: hypothetical protein IT307_05415, partial [Chloroflexi bacterium]|nr:hypothetical protein [Chloroflexota bacterium]